MDHKGEKIDRNVLMETIKNMNKMYNIITVISLLIINLYLVYYSKLTVAQVLEAYDSYTRMVLNTNTEAETSQILAKAMVEVAEIHSNSLNTITELNTKSLTTISELNNQSLTYMAECNQNNVLVRVGVVIVGILIACSVGYYFGILHPTNNTSITSPSVVPITIPSVEPITIPSVEPITIPSGIVNTGIVPSGPSSNVMTSNVRDSIELPQGETPQSARSVESRVSVESREPSGRGTPQIPMMMDQLKSVLTKRFPDGPLG